MADKNGNDNCLENLACPECGEHESLMIQVTTWVEMQDRGSGDHEDLEWDDNSLIRCPSCYHEAAAKSFMFE